MKIVLSIIAALLMAGCANGGAVTASQLNEAKASAYGLENTYLAALDVATAWARQPRCAPVAPPPPLCSTASGVLKIESYRADARVALDRLKMVIADVTSTPTVINAAMSAAQNAVAAYNKISKGG